MKSYLSLIPVSAKVHRRQNRVALLCIIFVVFIVTAMFSIVEMGARVEQARLAEKYNGFSISVSFNNTMGQTLLLSARIVSLLILFAGVLMISSSLNSNIVQKMKFFGMMRYIGMSKKQIVRFVRLGALNWYKTTVPIGLALGVSASWILCGVLRYTVGGEFSNVPLFGVNVIGIISGIVMGVITVLLATRSPANQTTKVSPVTAVSEDSEHRKMKNHTFHARSIRIETALGIHHATSAEENLLSMTGLSILSIILLLSFTVLIDSVNHPMSQSAATSGIDISSSGGLNSVDDALAETLRGINSVKQVCRRQGSFDIPTERDTGTVVFSAVDLVSLDDFDLDCLKKDGALHQGSSLSKVYENSNYALTAWDKDSSWEIGNKILTGDEEIEITGSLKYSPFNNNSLTSRKITLITSGQTFTHSTGITEYSLVMIQTTPQATDEDVSQLCNTAAESDNHFSGKRDQRTSGTYLVFVFCVYRFLGIITLVTVLNIVNNTSVSVSAEIKQYGTMWIVGMDEQQIVKMAFAEALIYTFWGGGIGCAIGLPFSKMLYDSLIFDHFPYAVWSLPVCSLVIILLFVAFTATLAAYASTKRIRDTSVTETINEL